MPSSPLDGKQGGTTSGMACHHHLWAAQTVERRQEWHSIIAFGLAHIVVRCRAWQAINALRRQIGRTTSGLACHHRLWAAHTVERLWAWNHITAFGQHTWSNDIECGMPSLPLGSTHGRMTLGVACHHSPWTTNTIEQRRALHSITAFGQYARSNDVRCDMPSWPLDSTHGRTTSSVACHHSPWTANMVKRRRARHAIIAFGLVDIVGRRRE